MKTQYEQLNFRLTRSQRDAIDKAAAAADLSASAWVRLVCIAATGDRSLLNQLRRAAEQGQG